MTAAVHLPPGPRWPLPIQGLAYIASRRRMMQVLSKRYGSSFTVRLPFFGPTVVISDPPLVKQFFQTRTDAGTRMCCRAWSMRSTLRLGSAAGDHS